MARIEFMQPGLENMTAIGDELALRWTDGVESYYPLEFLRKRCPCALCAGETDLLGNVYKGKMDLAPASFQLKRCTVVGGYGIQPEWADIVPEFILSAILDLSIRVSHDAAAQIVSIDELLRR
jgi:DUF971 family protein